MEQQNTQLSRSSLEEQITPSFTSVRFAPPQLPHYQQQWSSSQISSQSSQGNHINYSQPLQPFNGSFTHFLRDNIPHIGSGSNIALQPTAPPATNATKGRKKRAQKESNIPSNPKKQWTPEEDEALAKAWVSISDDSIIGDEQSSQTLWDRIFCAFNVHMKGVSKDRTSNSLACRWNAMHKDCSKFEGYYERCRRQERSGTNLRDDVQMAKEIFCSEEGMPFKWDKAWAVLYKEPKWNAKMMENSTKISSQTVGASVQVNDHGVSETIGNEEDMVTRPIGRKRAKEVRNNIGESGTNFIEYLSKIQTTIEAQTLCAQELAKGELELVQVKKQVIEAKIQAIEDRRKSEVLKEEERVMMYDWAGLPLELQEAWKDRQSIIRVKWMAEGRLTRKD